MIGEWGGGRRVSRKKRGEGLDGSFPQEEQCQGSQEREAGLGVEDSIGFPVAKPEGW